MAGAHADARVDTGTLGVLERFRGAVDVLSNGTGQADDGGVIACQLRDAANALEIAGARDRETCFDDVNVQT